MAMMLGVDVGLLSAESGDNAGLLRCGLIIFSRRLVIIIIISSWQVRILFYFILFLFFFGIYRHPTKKSNKIDGRIAHEIGSICFE